MHPAQSNRKSGIGSGNGPLSAAKERRTPNSGNVVAWPVSLVETPLSPFSTAHQLKLLPEVFIEDDGIDIPALRTKEAERSARVRAENTRRAYACDWKDFTGFCRKTGRDPLPARASTVTLYLTYESTQHLAVSTITRRLVAISSEHKRAGFASPNGADVGAVLANIRRELGSAPKPKTPISAEDLESMLETVGTGARGLRDRALLVLGFASGCRRGELAAFDLTDVTSAPQGLVLGIRRSKVDQDGKGRELGVHRGKHRETCPVRALQAWLAVRGNQAGPLFTHVFRGGKVSLDRLGGRAIARIVKRAAKSAGMQESQYAGHSLRSGCATAAAAGGADILAIARRLGHASTRTTERYVRHGSLFACNPLKGVL